MKVILWLGLLAQIEYLKMAVHLSGVQDKDTVLKHKDTI